MKRRLQIQSKYPTTFDKLYEEFSVTWNKLTDNYSDCVITYSLKTWVRRFVPTVHRTVLSQPEESEQYYLWDHDSEWQTLLQANMYLIFTLALHREENLKYPPNMGLRTVEKWFFEFLISKNLMFPWSIWVVSRDILNSDPPDARNSVIKHHNRLAICSFTSAIISGTWILSS